MLNRDIVKTFVACLHAACIVLLYASRSYPHWDVSLPFYKQEHWDLCNSHNPFPWISFTTKAITMWVTVTHLANYFWGMLTSYICRTFRLLCDLEVGHFPDLSFNRERHILALCKCLSHSLTPRSSFGPRVYVTPWCSKDCTCSWGWKWPWTSLPLMAN